MKLIEIEFLMKYPGDRGMVKQAHYVNPEKVSRFGPTDQAHINYVEMDNCQGPIFTELTLDQLKDLFYDKKN